MIPDIFIGSYIPGESLLHRLDPRTKLSAIIVLLTTLFCVRNPVNQCIALVLTVTLAILTGAGFRIWLWCLRRFLWMMIFAAVANILFVREGTVITAGSFSLPFTDEGIRRGLLFALQLAQAVVLSMCLTFTTSPIQITRACRKLAAPFQRYLSVEQTGLVLLMAMRFVPLLQEELRSIVDAQKSRGVEFDRGSLAIRAANLTAVLLPALSSTLRRADILANAMTARGFDPEKPRSEYEPLEFCNLDKKAAAFIVFYVILQASISQLQI
jgi:energy-coupling factor transport system permease protein